MIGRKLPHQTPGRPIAARTINRFAQLVEDLTRGQTLAGSGIGLDRRGRRERGFYARLSGTTSPYSFAEVYGQMSGSSLTWVTRPRGRTGTGAAYEDNAVAGLDNKVAWIEPALGAAGVWRFYFNRKGPPPPCASGRICVTVNGGGGCFTDPIAGVAITITDNASPPNVIATGSTSGTPAQFCADIPTAGTYHVTTHILGTTDQTATVNAVCGTDTGVTIAYPVNSLQKLCVNFTTCDATGPAVPGSGTATVTGPAGSKTIPIVGGSGCIVVGPGTYSAVVTGSGGGVSKPANFQPPPSGSPPCAPSTASFFSITGVGFAAGGLDGTQPGMPCSATLWVYGEDLTVLGGARGSQIGTGTLTLVVDPPDALGNVYAHGTAVVTIPETFAGYYNNFYYEYSWPNPQWSSTTTPGHTSTPFACYPLPNNGLTIASGNPFGLPKGPCTP
jgi:hypothetical protein